MPYFLIVFQLFITTVSAKDWVFLHSTESASDNVPKTLLFLQPQYAYTKGSNLSAGPFQGEEGLFNLNAPELTSAASFQMVRAIGSVRGNVPRVDQKINYLLAVDAGENLLTGSERTTRTSTNLQLTDVSFTLSYIPFAKMRVGQFVAPTSNEALKPVHFFDFANFTHFSIFTMMDWQLKSPGDGTSDNRPAYPNAGFRDIGLMVFDSFEFGDFSHTYTVMVGNGNGISHWETDGHEDLYWRYRLEWKIVEKENFEFVYWGLYGERDVQMSTGLEAFERQRSGVDLSYVRLTHRVDLSFGYADGMIFHGTLGAGQPGITNGTNQIASFLLLPDENARGYAASYIYDLSEEISMGLRYDQVDYGLRNPVNTRRFSTLALSAQYRLSDKNPTRLMFNFEKRRAEAPELAGSHAINQFLKGIDDRYSLNLFWFL